MSIRIVIPKSLCAYCRGGGWCIVGPGFWSSNREILSLGGQCAHRVRGTWWWKSRENFSASFRRDLFLRDKKVYVLSCLGNNMLKKSLSVDVAHGKSKSSSKSAVSEQIILLDDVTILTTIMAQSLFWRRSSQLFKDGFTNSQFLPFSVFLC